MGQRQSARSLFLQDRKYFDDAETAKIHVESLVEGLRGAPIAPEQHPIHDAHLEAAIRAWLEANEDAVVEAVGERSGELR